MIRNKHLIRVKQASQASTSRCITLRREAKDTSTKRGVEPIIAVPPTKSFDQVGTAPKIDTLQELQSVSILYDDFRTS